MSWGTLSVTNGSMEPFKCMNSDGCCDDSTVTVFPDWLVSVKVLTATVNRDLIVRRARERNCH